MMLHFEFYIFIIYYMI